MTICFWKPTFKTFRNLCNTRLYRYQIAFHTNTLISNCCVHISTNYQMYKHKSLKIKLTDFTHGFVWYLHDLKARSGCCRDAGKRDALHYRPYLSRRRTKQLAGSPFSETFDFHHSFSSPSRQYARGVSAHRCHDSMWNKDLWISNSRILHEKKN